VARAQHADAVAEHVPAIELDPTSTALVVVDMQYASACRTTGLGRLLHESGDYERGERAYREALDVCGDDAVLYFNLAVLLEERARVRESMQAYEAALRVDPQMADAHYNLSLLYKRIGRARDALRHMGEYRRLAG